MLRVMEAARSAAESDDAGNDAAFRLYREFGARIHHDGDHTFDIADALDALGLDPGLADAADDADTWDPVIRASMEDGLGLTGDDVGTPIIATTNRRGERVGYFGPVITKVPRGDDATRLWDGLMALMDTDGFFELKKTRTEVPDPGERPATA